MCGILGIAVNPGVAPVWLHSQLPEVLTRLMIANNDRGGDSYGMVTIPLKPGIAASAIRRVGKFPKEIEDGSVIEPWYKEITTIERHLAEGTPVVVMGHNRKATHGEITQRNAMPFVFGEPNKDEKWIAGIHNGVINKYAEIADHLKIEELMEVDSEVIFRAVSKGPVDEALSYVSGGGSSSIVYMHNELDKLYFFRDSNPLYYMHREGALVWSSSERDLRVALGGLGQTIKSTDPNMLHTVELDKMDAVSSVKISSRFVIRPAREYTTQYPSSPNGWDYDNEDYWVNRQSAAPKSASASDVTLTGWDKRPCHMCSELLPIIEMLTDESGLLYCGWCSHGTVIPIDPAIKLLKGSQIHA